MNSDLQAIMARRRRLAEAKQEVDVAKAGSTAGRAKQPQSGFLTSPKGSIPTSNTDAKKASPDLQAIMAHRRRLTEANEDDGDEVAPGAPGVSPSYRRGTMGDTSVSPIYKKRSMGTTSVSPIYKKSTMGDTSVSPSYKKSTMGDTSVSPSYRRDAMEGSLTDLYAELATSKSNLSQGSHSQMNSSLELHQSKSGEDLSSIMERRRRIAEGDGGGPSPPAPSPPKKSPRVNYALSPTLALGEKPSAVSSPLNESLKSFGVSSDLQSILARRRRLNESGEQGQSLGTAERVRSPKDRKSVVPSPPLVADTLEDEAETGLALQSAQSRRSQLSAASTHSRQSNRDVARPDPTELASSSSHSHQQTSSSRHSPSDIPGSASVGEISVASSQNRKSESSDESKASSQDKAVEPAALAIPVPVIELARKEDDFSKKSAEESAPKSSPTTTNKNDFVSSSSDDDESLEDTLSSEDTEEREQSSVAQRDLQKNAPTYTEESMTLSESLDERVARLVKAAESPPQTKGPSKASTARRRQHNDSKTSGHSQSKKASPRLRPSRRSHDSEERSVQSKDSQETQRQRRASRRSNIGSSDEEHMSLRSLAKANRRGSTGTKDSDEHSRSAESAESSNRLRSRRSSTVGRTLRQSSNAENVESDETIPSSRSRSPPSRQPHEQGHSASELQSLDVASEQKPSNFANKPENSEHAADDKTEDEAINSGWGDFPIFAPKDGLEKPITGTEKNNSLSSSQNVSSHLDVTDPFVVSPNVDRSSSAEADGRFEPVLTSVADGFNDATFGNGTFDHPTATNGQISVSARVFDSGFSPDAFEATNVFGSHVFNEGFAGPETFEQPHFGLKESIMPQWDSSPLERVPLRRCGKLILDQQDFFSTDFACAPTSNLSNGNVIFACSGKDGFFLKEIDPSRNSVPVCSTPVLTIDLQRKVSSKYNVSIYKVHALTSLTSGLHESHSQSRVRVASVLEVNVLESPQLMKIVAVWQWGYGTAQPIVLQYTITPPSGADYIFDAATLQIADNLVFIAGSSPKGPCVFITKPAARDSWSANFLGGSGFVSALAVTTTSERAHPFVAVGLTDRSLSVWTYAEAMKPASKDSESSKRWLFPLCRLEAGSVLSSRESKNFVSEEPSDADSKEVGYCTHFAWMPTVPMVSYTLMLAASFQNALAIYHVELPATMDPSTNSVRPLSPPTHISVLSQAPLLGPMVAERWRGRHERSSAIWLNRGPHVDPCLALLGHTGSTNGSAVRLAIGCLIFSQYAGVPVPEDKMVPFRLLAGVTITNANKSYPLGIVPLPHHPCVICHSRNKLSRFVPTLALDNAIQHRMAWMAQPPASIPPGLSSVGDRLLTDTDNDAQGVLHIFSTLQFERRASTDSSVVWGQPVRRYWLCRTIAGDNRTIGKGDLKNEKLEKDFGRSDRVNGGSASRAVAALADVSIADLVPFRIVRCRGKEICAVLFQHGFRSQSTELELGSNDAVAVALVDFSTPKTILQVVEGRDICFCFDGQTDFPQGLLLSKDGSMLTSFSWQSMASKFETGRSYRPILGVEVGDQYIECRRVFAFSGASKLVLVMSGISHQNGTTHILAGDLRSDAEVSITKWSSLLPNMEIGRSFKMNRQEEVLSIIGLEHDDSGYRNFAVATSERVFVLSAGLDLCAETTIELSFPSLVPMGSFAVCFISQDKVKYLCCLDADLSLGVVASLPTEQYGDRSPLLLALRQDRIILNDIHTGVRLVEYGQSPDGFLLPACRTHPALILEPMVANAVCVGGKQHRSTEILRTVIEKFGRKVASITHGDDEGIGHFGAGLQSKVFEILRFYGLDQAASWLLTGTVQFTRTANSKILPTWLPIGLKRSGAINSDAFLHLVSSGDQYLLEYLKSPNQNLPATIPRSTDASSYFSHDFAMDSLGHGIPSEAVKSLDFAGSSQADNLILQIALILQKDRSQDITEILRKLSGYDEPMFSRSSEYCHVPGSLAALAVSLKSSKSNTNRQVMSSDHVERWMRPLAPSLQRGATFGRTRQKLIGESDFINAGSNSDEGSDNFWSIPCNEAKHVWNEGPRKAKDKLLMLDSTEEWLGRRRPAILGKEGVSAARDRGEGALAGILNNEEDSFGVMSDNESIGDDWVDGVGEGRSDEANLSAYFRMSEGDDEDSQWQTEGLLDISPYQIKATVIGDAGAYRLQTSTSGVDEGEPGKVRSLHDLVFERSGEGVPSGLAVPAGRGSSVDVGVLHRPDRQSRQKCSIEFWYYLPKKSAIVTDIILTRRTMGSTADDLSKVSISSEKESVLWDLVLLQSGEVQFRSCGGATLLSSKNNNIGAAKVVTNNQDEEQRKDIVAYEHWNHICVVMNSRDLDLTECFVSLYMKGTEVASNSLSMLLPGYEKGDLADQSTLDDLLHKSQLIFGVNSTPGFRITEIRIWACSRSADDTQAMMYEYLNAAETKKKFKVKIKNKKGGALGKGGLASPLMDTGKGAAKSGTAFMLKGAPSLDSSGKMQLETAADASNRFSLAPPSTKQDESERKLFEVSNPSSTFKNSSDAFSISATENDKSHPLSYVGVDKSRQLTPSVEEVQQNETHPPVTSTLWDTALPLSQQVRSSAAAALIRGPPATRHFGGNRGGLPDFSGMERFGVGGVAICGSEKTIVWRDNEDPPALTYPIGASGAIVSDQMDDEGSEFLCCFLAKEKRMVVFELQSRTVVVELQMTTKLNFWRFLPPEADENTLCFMLITPVGGFHWMPLEESPRPHQVWKRGPELQGKKVVSYEEGGSNGLDDSHILSRVGLVLVTKPTGDGTLEAWIVPISGDSQASQFSEDVMGACFCQPPHFDEGPFLPLLVTVHLSHERIVVNLLTTRELSKGSIELGEAEVTQEIDDTGFEDVDYRPPSLAMGDMPEALCCSLANIVVVIVRRKGLVVAYELEDGELSLIASENVGHFVIDAVMRYSAEVGGAEIVMLLSDNEFPKDGRMVSFCFRSAV
jgi:hypothetical protein